MIPLPLITHVPDCMLVTVEGNCISDGLQGGGRGWGGGGGDGMGREKGEGRRGRGKGEGGVRGNQGRECGKKGRTEGVHHWVPLLDVHPHCMHTV